jgi:hypothetical protein
MPLQMAYRIARSALMKGFRWLFGRKEMGVRCCDQMNKWSTSRKRTSANSALLVGRHAAASASLSSIIPN